MKSTYEYRCGDPWSLGPIGLDSIHPRGEVNRHLLLCNTSTEYLDFDHGMGWWYSESASPTTFTWPPNIWPPVVTREQDHCPKSSFLTEFIFKPHSPASSPPPAYSKPSRLVLPPWCARSWSMTITRRLPLMFRLHRHRLKASPPDRHVNFTGSLSLVETFGWGTCAESCWYSGAKVARSQEKNEDLCEKACKLRYNSQILISLTFCQKLKISLATLKLSCCARNSGCYGP